MTFWEWPVISIIGSAWATWRVILWTSPYIRRRRAAWDLAIAYGLESFLRAFREELKQRKAEFGVGVVTKQGEA